MLSVYVNCSAGGMGTVYRNRARASAARHDLVFGFDKGGMGSFVDLDNVTVEIVPSDRIGDRISLLTLERQYEQVRITALPGVVSAVARHNCGALVYEIHSAGETARPGELAALDLDRIDQIWVPSSFQRDLVSGFLAPKVRERIRIVPNWADPSTFNATVPPLWPDDGGDRIPLLWVGRFESPEKNAPDLLRVLSMLPEAYHAIMVLSFDTSTQPTAEILSTALAYGIADRVSLFHNLTPHGMASVYRAVALRSGILCSTGLFESFGLGIVEASLCGLPVVAFAVGALREHVELGFSIDFVEVGDVAAMVEAIVRLQDKSAWRAASTANIAVSENYRETVASILQGLPELI